MTKKRSVHVWYRCNHCSHRPNYIVHGNNKVNFFPNTFNLWLVESADAEPQIGRAVTTFIILTRSAQATELNEIQRSNASFSKEIS